MLLAGCDEGLDVLDAFLVQFAVSLGNHGGEDRPGLLGASRKILGGVDGGVLEMKKNVGSSRPRGTIIVLSIASDHADLLRVISSGLLRQAQDFRPNRRPLERRHETNVQKKHLRFHRFHTRKSLCADQDGGLAHAPVRQADCPELGTFHLHGVVSGRT